MELTKRVTRSIGGDVWNTETHTHERTQEGQEKWLLRIETDLNNLFLNIEITEIYGLFYELTKVIFNDLII